MVERMKDLIVATHRLKRTIEQDKNKPIYHFCVPFDLGFPADPNGIFYSHGLWHMTYIYESREDSYRYGHVVSKDFLHWRNLPDALTPDETDGGIYSGGVLLEEDGRAIMAYWALGKGNKNGGIRIAVSFPPLYDTWTKLDGYAVPCDRLGVCVSDDGKELACADPGNLWKENGKYYMQLGNLPLLDEYRNKRNAPKEMLGDYTDLFESEDLKTWRYVHRFYKRNADNFYTAESEDCMCPYFAELPFKDGTPSGKYIQLFLAHNRGTQYYIGDYDRENVEFHIEKHGRMSFADNCLFAPEGAKAPDGRLITAYWLRDNQDDDLRRELLKGWSGIHALPRSLYLRSDGNLGIEPIKELDSLLLTKREYTLENNEERKEIFTDTPNHCKIVLHAESFSEGCLGIEVLYDETKKESLIVAADFESKSLIVDALNSGTLGRKVKDVAPFNTNRGEPLDLEIFLDGCVIEVFANSIQAMTRQIFVDASNVKIFAFYKNVKKGKLNVTAYDTSGI